MTNLSIGKTTPIPEARRFLMPREAYLSEAWYAEEQEKIFEKSWNYVGLTNDFVAAGDYMTVQVGRQPLLIIRGNDGQLRAFYNICRHRGAQLLEGNGNAAKGVSCFYHRWHYGLEGDLQSLPQPEKFPCLDKSNLGLKPASVGVWNGLVFIHADASPAVSLEQWLGEFPKHHGPWKPAELVTTARQTHVMNANWKLFLENHIDGYHLFHLHAKSIPGLDHYSQKAQIVGRHWTLYEKESVAGQLPERVRSTAPRFPLIPEVSAAQYGSTVHHIFPALATAAGASYYAMVKVIPISAKQTRIETRFLTKPTGVMSLLKSPGFLLESAKSVITGKSAFDIKAAPSNPHGDFVGEDVYAVEAIQRTMESDRFEVGPLAQDWEESINAFHRSLLTMMNRAESH